MRTLQVCMSVCLAAVSPALAAPHFTERQIVVQGNQNVDVTGINDSGTMVGTLYAPITGAPSGITLKNQAVSIIPPPYSIGGAAQPTSIYNDGTIIGTVHTFAGLDEIFVSRHGVIDPKYQIVLDYGVPPGMAPLGINPIGLVGPAVYFTRVISRTLPNIGEHGTPPKLHALPHLAQFATIKGLSAAGVVSGTAFQERGPQSVFLGNDGQYQFIAPPGAISASGGFANRAGAVAGTFIDSANVPHGFVYNSGHYTTFDMPNPPSEIVINAINAKGWVAGFFADSAGNRQHAFFFDGTSVTVIGAFDAQNYLNVSLNNAGQLVIAEQFFDPVKKYVSFLETCRASAC